MSSRHIERLRQEREQLEKSDHLATGLVDDSSDEEDITVGNIEACKPAFGLLQSDSESSDDDNAPISVFMEARAKKADLEVEKQTKTPKLETKRV